ncbi:TPR repeat-containing protein [Chloroherpeton thalassium ATCC 35110]|uniref:TPR repeat-containing protein n=1 Tax=Chloroherpeton thalassium (strain ATCC 35110 / GB-78) TaxID=517418 RepID=B3QY11_CHLT3|nr:tetratricopeptide repeat protein [Chloroherpeton thalassium]ACF13539.1 TPR repeat-containing protein [Chloroherpeton thalassium ATCC 35110]
MGHQKKLLWIIIAVFLFGGFFSGCGTPREKSIQLMSSAGQLIGQAQELQRKIDMGEGNAAQLQGQIDQLKIEAIKQSKEAIETDTSNVDAYYNFGIILQSIQQFNKAIEQYKIGLSKIPQPPYHATFDKEMADSLQNLYNNFNVGLVVCNKNMKNYTESIAYANNVKQYFPSRYAEALFNYGFFLQATMSKSNDPVKQVDSAITVFQHSIRWYGEAAARGSADPTQIYQTAYYTEQAYRAKAKAANTKPDYDGIVDAYQQAAKADPRNPEIYVRLAATYDEAGQSNKALDVYKTAVEKNPENRTVVNNYAMLLAEKGKTKDAITQLSSLVEKNPSYAMAYFNMASVLQKTGKSLRSAEVKKYLMKYVELAKNDPAQAQNVKEVEQLIK